MFVMSKLFSVRQRAKYNHVDPEIARLSSCLARRDNNIEASQNFHLSSQDHVYVDAETRQICSGLWILVTGIEFNSE
jgi:hypothetical protein